MFTITVTFTLLLLFVCVESAPIQHASQANSTTKPEYEQPWVSSPARRGTLDILFSCILTLLLCVWTTLHTNIEPEIWKGGKHGQHPAEVEGHSLDQTKRGPDGHTYRTSGLRLPRSLTKRYTNMNPRKMVWSVVTLLFPEIALFVAAHERKVANLLCKKMKKVEQPKGVWDMTLSYYAIMGGFVVKPKTGDTDTTSTNGELDLQRLEEHCTLTPQGVLYLAQEGKLPYYPTQIVKDKSKANLLGKFLVCFQAIWMIIQVMGRYASRLPVTLLELYTVLHTLCAVAMYIIWIGKPFDITQPTFIPLSSDVLQSLMTKGGGSGPDRHQTNKEGSSGPDCHSTNKEGSSGSGDHPISIFWRDDYIYTECLTTRAGLGKLLFRQLWDWHRFKEGRWVERFTLFLGAYSALWNGWKEFGWQALALSIVGMVYGGLHLVAWKFDFPSHIEHKLWKIAAVLTAAALTVFCFSVLIGFLGKSVWDKVNGRIGAGNGGLIGKCKDVIDWVHNKHETLRWWYMTIYCIGFVLAIAPCILARLYLLVESFVSMRQLPYGSYDKVIWANFLPHVG